MQTSIRYSDRELWLAFVIILVVTFAYLGGMIILGGIPPASELFGHGLGILGFILMLMTETLYSIRKRSRRARWGRTSSWLNFHIVTGIVGPYMVLLHTSWKFNGLAGLTLFLTLLVVLSGFVGRYIYTAIPRSIEGFEFDENWLQDTLSKQQLELDRWITAYPKAANTFFRRLGWQNLTPDQTLTKVARKFRGGWWIRLQWEWAMRGLNPLERSPIRQLYDLLLYQERLRRQMRKLTIARRLFSLWHTIHIPLGLALFTAAFIHIGAAIYYATLLK
jgi:hypothetical protein